MTSGGDAGFDLEQLPPHVKKLLIRRFGSLENVPVEFKQMAERTMKKFMPLGDLPKPTIVAGDDAGFEKLPSFVKFLVNGYPRREKSSLEKTSLENGQRVEQMPSKDAGFGSTFQQKEDKHRALNSTSLPASAFFPSPTEKDNGLGRLLFFIGVAAVMVFLYVLLTGAGASVFSFFQSLFSGGRPFSR